MHVVVRVLHSSAFITSIRIKLKNEVGMAGLLCIMHLVMSHDVFVECGMWEIFRLFPSCHNGSSLSVFIITCYFCTLKKA